MDNGDEVVGMIRDSLRNLQDTCQGIRDDMAEHVRQDAVYWRKIDQQDGALGVWKWIAGSGGLLGIFSAAYHFFFGRH